MYKEQEVCRVCSGTLTSVLNVGEIYPSNFVAESDGKKGYPERAGLYPQALGPIELHFFPRSREIRIIQ